MDKEPAMTCSEAHTHTHTVDCLKFLRRGSPRNLEDYPY